MGMKISPTETRELGRQIVERAMTLELENLQLRAALQRAQKIIERDFPNGQLAIDIRNALAHPNHPPEGEQIR